MIILSYSPNSQNLLTKQATINQNKSKKIKSNNSLSEPKPTQIGTTSNNSSSLESKPTSSYCPLSNGQLVLNNSTYSCAVLDQGECWSYKQTVDDALFSSVDKLQSTINGEANSAWNMAENGATTNYIIQTINQYYSQGNSELHGLYETYVQNFVSPYPNCSPLTESQAHIPFTLLSN